MTLKEAADALVVAIILATEEHGSPNGFGWAELEEYGGPPAMLAGRAARRYQERLFRQAGARMANGRVEVGRNEDS